MSDPLRVLAVDLGATSVRVAAVDLAADEPRSRCSIVGSMPRSGGRRVPAVGLAPDRRRGGDRAGAGLATGPVASIGVDGWGVDYGLVDGSRAPCRPSLLLPGPRTEGWEATAERIGVDHLYEVTGVQLMGINTIFQLAAHDVRRAGTGRPDSAASRSPRPPPHRIRRGRAIQRLDHRPHGCPNRGLGPELIADLSLDPSLFPPWSLPGPRPAVAGSPGPSGWEPRHGFCVPRDARGAGPGTVFVSTGTWVIVGIERPGPDTSLGHARPTSPTRPGLWAGSDSSRTWSVSGSSISVARLGRSTDRGAARGGGVPRRTGPDLRRRRRSIRDPGRHGTGGPGRRRPASWHASQCHRAKRPRVDRRRHRRGGRRAVRDHGDRPGPVAVVGGGARVHCSTTSWPGEPGSLW